MRIVKCYFLKVKGANIASSELSIIQFALQEKYQNDRNSEKFGKVHIVSTILYN